MIDTGVRPGPRLPNVDPGGDFVESTDGLSDCDGHGTLVAGLIAGQPGPDGFSGVAPGARLLSIRSTSARSRRATRARMRRRRLSARHPRRSRGPSCAADLGARVINVSGGHLPGRGKTVDQTELGAALRYAAVEKDAVVVAAAATTEPDQPGFRVPVEPTLGPRPTRRPTKLGGRDVRVDPVVVAAVCVVRRCAHTGGRPIRLHHGGSVGGNRRTRENIASVGNADGGGLANGLANEQGCSTGSTVRATP